ncbi:hypothetical protein WJX73_005712 [Symbiochloris irregularis]|uniref:FAD dependent oxidoreductase domain-containing protein n=1 Tax=Symbiochloris irregularis TaxID=706552 RepID=A0AAW1NIQ1_9CHLO
MNARRLGSSLQARRGPPGPLLLCFVRNCRTTKHAGPLCCRAEGRHVIVLGAGIVGLSCAASILKASQDTSVTLVDQYNLCQGATGAGQENFMGLFVPGDTQLDGRQAARLLLSICTEQGCRFTAHLQQQVQEVLLDSTGRQAIGLKCNGQQILADAVVVAAGAWTGHLLASIPPLAGQGWDTKVLPRRGHLLEVVPPSGMPALRHGLMEAEYAQHYTSTTPADTAGCDFTFTATTSTSGTLLIGSSREFSGWETRPDSETGLQTCVLMGLSSILAFFALLTLRKSHFTWARSWPATLSRPLSGLNKGNYVALLFLTRAGLPHEPVWQRWLQKVANVIPETIACEPELLQCFQSSQVVAQPKSVYDRQYLFSFYVHPPPHHTPFKEGSVFWQRDIQDRHKVAWGGMGMIKAHQSLLKAALEDPFNQQFQLLCDYTVPIRAPVFAYTQLIGHNASRLARQWTVDVDESHIKQLGRFHIDFYEAWPDLHKYRRRHTQWVTVNRKHAHIIMDDTKVFDLFQKHCYVTSAWGDARCIPDEAYVGTLLSSKVDSQDELDGNGTMVILATGPGFDAASISEEFLLEARGSVVEPGPAAHPRENIVEQEDWHGKCMDVDGRPQIPMTPWNHPDCRQHETSNTTIPPHVELHPGCFIWARKIAHDATEKVVTIWGDLGILNAWGLDYENL